ncbi:ankyrin repeat and SOCS box protein 13-like isoform X2 [Anguilla anguilla]|uniref:ankyrin repeat and SOCS box protein 13-like isoform X2 n=1 Tax=Anguilla anguilla TaxID=7936 RepID=UPI0015AAB0A5|nr:ankyrin repeat and SOCS box protein 13-like isoform X2 [Anguilla anguilla]
MEMDVATIRPSFFGEIGLWAVRTVVHDAAFFGHTLLLQQLIQSGAPVNIVNLDNITPLHEACIQGQTQCVRLLLEAGAQVDIRTVHGSTALCNACAAGSPECIRLLLEYGAAANPTLTALTATPLHEACIRGANVNAARFHETALHIAAKENNADLIEMLVALGAHVHARDNLGRKPIDYTSPGSPAALCLELSECTPPSLQHLSRLALWNGLGKRMLQVVSKVGLPCRILSYLYCS